MKIVIDIDVNIYTRLFDNCKNSLYDMRAVCSAVRKGTIVPSGHGRLIDGDELLEHAWRTRLDSRERISELIESMPTIVSIDKETTKNDK